MTQTEEIMSVFISIKFKCGDCDLMDEEAQNWYLEGEKAMSSKDLGKAIDLFVKAASGRTSPEDLKCGICLEILNDPKQCPPGRTFPSTCLTEHLKKSDKCPFNCAAEPVAQNLIARKWIDHLEVYCQFHFHCQNETWEVNKQGCDFIGTFGDISTHETNCLFAILRCQFCAQNFTAPKLPGHSENCPSKPIPCNLCNKQIMQKELQVSEISPWLICRFLFNKNVQWLKFLFFLLTLAAKFKYKFTSFQ